MHRKNDTHPFTILTSIISETSSITEDTVIGIGRNSYILIEYTLTKYQRPIWELLLLWCSPPYFYQLASDGHLNFQTLVFHIRSHFANST
ncbi:unnamed protein product [Blepharisma stoltei]|uniref:Uncharacterized protein n=1 Tax=Blepharisma stoltei TaxID=1481888 RepID=A0AAU9IFY0_9CILI|nr:unnamed protein product [Blepharisma stoltei]